MNSSMQPQPWLEWLVQNAGDYDVMELSVWTSVDRFLDKPNIPAFAEWLEDDRYGLGSREDWERLGCLLSWEWFDDARNTPPIGKIRAWFKDNGLATVEVALGEIAERNIRLHRHLTAMADDVNDRLYHSGRVDGYVIKQIRGLWAAAHAIDGRYACRRRNENFRESANAAKDLWLDELSRYRRLGDMMFPNDYLQSTVQPALSSLVTDLRLAEEADHARRNLKERAKLIHGFDKPEADEDTSDDGRRKFLYVMRQGEAVKIGISVDPQRRARELNTGPREGEIALVAYREVADARGAEKHLHRRLRRHNIRNEWFRANATVEKAVQQFIPTASIIGTPNTGTAPHGDPGLSGPLVRWQPASWRHREYGVTR